MRSLTLSLARLLSTVYFVGSSLYCLLGYSSFANEQFIRPQLIGWLPGLVARHHELFWLTVLVTLPTLVPTLRHGTPRRRGAAAAYLGLNAAIGLWLTSNPVLSMVGSDSWTLTLAFLCLLPPFALAVLDHVTVSPPVVARIDDRRLFLTVAAASILVWLTYAVLLPWYIARTPGIDLTPAALGVAVGISLVSHLFLFALVYLVAGVAFSVASLHRRSLAQYWTVFLLSIVAVASVLERVVADGLSFGRAESWILSGGISVVLVAVWSGLAWQHADGAAASGRRSFETGPGAQDSIDIWFLPMTFRLPAFAIVGVIALPALALGLRAAVEHIDWNFMLQKLGVCVVWVIALSGASKLTRRFARLPSVGRRTGLVAAVMIAVGLGGVPAASRLSAWTGDARLDPEFVLDRYSAFDASYHLVRDLVETNVGEHASFYTFLKAHSTLGLVAAEPVEVSFVETFEKTTRPPHVFLFIVDSLRPDYLSPYNHEVSFTPATQAFAAESVVFERAFTRYGSTGLSVPALWAGGMLLHKQYVKPFAPMNALEKLLDGVGYRRFLSDDHLVTQLFRPSTGTTLLDEAIQEMDHTMCATTRELQSKLDEMTHDRRPVFAMTRPLQLHTARLVRDPPTSAAAYPGFVPRYAAQVAAFDRCLGDFVAYLKRTGLYEESVVVVTSDHGESLGEDGRWGHGNALHPEVVRIPLIIHVPMKAASGLVVDRSQVALSTDITPTLYLLAGQRPVDRGSLYGVPLFTPVDRPIPVRRRESFLLSSSYGPGYAMLRHNGRTLYIADAVQGRDFAYEMGTDGKMARQTVTDVIRTVNRTLIQEQIGAIASEYRFSPR
jgi:hypothetical protein